MQTGEYAQCDPSELEQLIRRSSFEEAADLLSRSMNPTLFSERVEHNLCINDSSSINGAVCLLPSLFPGLVLTTNLDNVLEHLYQQSPRKWCKRERVWRKRDHRVILSVQRRKLEKATVLNVKTQV